MPTPAAFLFDLDGTLADTLPDIAASTNHVRSAFGLPPLALAGVRELIGEGPRVLLTRALGQLVATETALDHAVALYRNHHDLACTDQAVPFPGVVDGLGRLAAAGHPMAVVTNKPERFARRVLDHLGLDRWLPVVVGGDTLPERKPDPAPLRLALRQLGITGTDAAMVGDSEYDLRAGRACGLRTIACLYGYRPEPVLRAERPDACWSRFLG